MEEVQEGFQERSYSITKLWSRHKEIIRLVSSGLYTQNEVAKITGNSIQTISNVMNCALGKQARDILEGVADAEAVDLMARYKVLAPLALAIQQEMLIEESTTKNLKNDIANKIQDRAGYVPVTKNISVNVNRALTREDIESIKSRARELKEMQVGG